MPLPTRQLSPDEKKEEDTKEDKVERARRQELQVEASPRVRQRQREKGSLELLRNQVGETQPRTTLRRLLVRGSVVPVLCRRPRQYVISGAMNSQAPPF